MHRKRPFDEILSADKDCEGTITLRRQTMSIGRADRMALVMLNALMSEYPEATNGDVSDALLNAVWWHIQIAADAVDN